MALWALAALVRNLAQTTLMLGVVSTDINGLLKIGHDRTTPRRALSYVLLLTSAVLGYERRFLDNALLLARKR